MNDHGMTIRAAIDFISIGAVISIIAGFLPPIAALLSIIWLSVQLHDRIKYGPRK